MANTREQICNQALSDIGGRVQITNFETDTSPAAVQCRLWYDTLRQAMLQAAPWSFARKTVPLTQLQLLSDIPMPSGMYPWQVKYLYPADCLRMNYILPPPFPPLPSVAPNVGGGPVFTSIFGGPSRANRFLPAYDDGVNAPVTLRTPSVSFNDTANNPNLYNACGFIDLVIPANYDSEGIEQLLFNVVGGMSADGDAPTSADMSIEMGFYVVNGGSALTATLSPDGFGYLPGALVTLFGLGGISPEWTSIELNQPSNPYGIGGDNTNQRGNVLEDGTSQGFPGTGFNHSTDFAPWVGPIGWSPDASLVSTTITNLKLQPSQTVTLFIQTFVESNDTVNPDRKVHGVIQSITMSYKGVVTTIPLENTKVGFSNGGSYTAVPEGTFGSPVFNARRGIENTIPPLTSPQQDFYTDTVQVPAREVILSNILNAYGVYVVDVTDPNFFNASFSLALTAALSYKLVMPITGNAGMKSGFRQIAQDAIIQARVKDGNEAIPSTDHTPDWISGRGASSYTQAMGGFNLGQWYNGYTDMSWGE